MLKYEYPEEKEKNMVDLEVSVIHMKGTSAQNIKTQGRRGSVHIYWDTKQRLLKQKYGIDWSSPGELNPHVIFD
jgi:hypothetical protein